MMHNTELIAFAKGPLQNTLGESNNFPNLILHEGKAAARAYLNFFTAEIENDKTRAAYAKAIGHFLSWCEARGRRHSG